jgi:hypothetical protein
MSPGATDARVVIDMQEAAGADCHTLHDRPDLPAASVIEHHNWVRAKLIAAGSFRIATERSI